MNANQLRKCISSIGQGRLLACAANQHQPARRHPILFWKGLMPLRLLASPSLLKGIRLELECDQHKTVLCRITIDTLAAR